MITGFTVKFHDYAMVPVFAEAYPDIDKIICTNVDWTDASTTLVREAAKAIDDLGSIKGQSASVHRVDSSMIVVKYYDGGIERYRRFYIENYDDDMDDADAIDYGMPLYGDE